jgi:glycosyltransferase involved in cell wall biosynthesis
MSKNKNRTMIYIAGQGELAEDLKKRAEYNKINLVLLGQINEFLLCEYLAIADFFLLPSLSDPSPLSVIEALWSSKPLLLSKLVGNIHEALVEGFNGFSFDVLNKSDVAVIDNALEMSTEWLKQASKISCTLALERFDSKSEVSKFSYFLANELEE